MNERKNDLTCGVARDLLPLYVEGLTGPEATAAVESHLCGCPACTACKNAMAAPEPAAGPAAADAGALDYLKTLRSRGRWRMLAAAAVTALMLICAALAKIYLIGSAADAAAMEWSVSEADGMLYLEVTPALPGQVWFDWEDTRADGTVTITARQAAPSVFHRGGSVRFQFPAETAENIKLCGVTVRQGGVTIRPETLKIWQARTPYVGSMSALGALARGLGTGALCGDFTNELQTSREPYGWTLNFTARYPDEAAEGGGQSLCPPARTGAQLNAEMHSQAIQMLALVENLGEVRWTSAGTDPQGRGVLTLAQAQTELGERTARYNRDHGTAWEPKPSLKDYAASPADLQVLRNILYDRAA